MMPTLQPGWFVLVDPFADPVPGDVVTVRHPEDRDVVMIKRLGGFRDGGVWVESDNPAEGTDSREFGPLPIDHLVGRVTLVLDDVRRPLAEASCYEEPS